MAILTLANLFGTVTLDESSGLQNLTTTPNPPNPAGDADDNDILYDDSSQGAFPTAFHDWLATQTAPIDVALSNYDGTDTT